MNIERITEILTQPMYICRGDITRKMYSELFDWYRVLVEDEIKECTLLVDSEGGEVEPAMDMYNIIRLASIANGIRTTALITREACSAATLVLLGCDYRVGLRESRYLIHPVSFMTPMTLSDITGILDQNEAMSEFLEDQMKSILMSQMNNMRILKERTKLDHEKLLKSSAQDVWLTTREAQAFGMIHEIIEL